MIILLDTSTPVCSLTFVEDEQTADFSWQADRQLAKGLLGFIQDSLNEKSCSWGDLTGIGVFAGPGSYTGLRIGLTVMNTIADAESVAIVGARGDNWRSDVLKRLGEGQNDLIALPFYGGDANITTPRK